MYSGITQGLFPIIKVTRHPSRLDYTVTLNKEIVKKLKRGSSVNVDGVCQTVVNIHETNVSFTAILETLERTTLNTLYEGRQVSIEPSLRYGDEVGGHLLAGHIFGTAEIISIIEQDDSLSMDMKCPHEWMQYLLPKGFIGIDGSSLTLGNVDSMKNIFTVHLIPETLRVTNFGNKKIGELVNIELDQQTVAIINHLEYILGSAINK